MKYRSIINYLILTSTNFFSLWIQPAFSSITILNCSGEIPNKTPCLIEANQYKINISRIDICQENPFPNYKITPDYGGAKCINLLDKNSKKVRFPRKAHVKFKSFIVDEIRQFSVTPTQ